MLITNQLENCIYEDDARFDWFNNVMIKESLSVSTLVADITGSGN